MRLVLDTNVVVAGVRSPAGASAAVLEAVAEGKFTLICNPALFLEYEAVLKRPEHLAAAGLASSDVDVFLAGLARLLEPAGQGRSMRPQLSDPDDEMVLEAAIFGRAEAIVTFEIKTFQQAATTFGMLAMTPAELWSRVKV